MFKACRNSDMVRGNLQDVLDAGRRTTPDREAIIEECAKVCEELSEGFSAPGKRRTRVIAAAMQGALTSAHAIRTLKTRPVPSSTFDVQWWLAELDQHGNPKLSDGAHSERAGADKAMYLIQNLGLNKNGKRWAVARVELSEPQPSAKGVNMDAVASCRAMVDAAREGETR
ncbi:hypothetical protein DIE01_16120 [Burkholderia sp. Bp8990]|nr:hypothetical protein DIE01_16120 [Burkholderia sp. Bp8990]